MILGALAILGILLAWAAGADLRRLARVRLRATGVVFVALGVQLALFTPASDVLPLPLPAASAHVATYFVLILFIVANIRQPGFPLAGLGLLLNLAPILSNGGRMPVSLDAWRATGRDSADIADGVYNNTVLAGSEAHLWWLGDVFHLPAVVPLANALSVGDIALLTGVVTFVYRASLPRLRRSRRALLEALGSASFRRLVLGRTASKMGDWLTMAAVVTWLYGETHSPAVVSAFLAVRISGAIGGGIVAAPLIDRFPRFRTLSLLEAVRGSLILAAVPVALGGHVFGVIVLVALSAMLAAAVDPNAQSLVPELLPARLVHVGNAIHGVARNIVMVLGAIAGAIAVAALGIAGALLIDVATFAFAALLYRAFGAWSRGGEDEPERSSWRAVVSALIRSRVAFGLTMSFAAATAAMGILNASLPRFLDHNLGRPDAYGYAMGAIALGLLCGEALSSSMRREVAARRSIALSFLLSAALVFLLSGSETATTVYLLLFLLGASDGVTEVVYDTLFQSQLPHHLRGGAFALAGAFQNVGMIAGFLLAPVLLLAGSQTALFVSAGACLISAAIAATALAKPLDPHATLLEPEGATPAGT